MREDKRKFLSTAIYVRVSTEEQKQEGFSIKAQIEKLKTYALLKDWDIYDIYNDAGISGKNITERPDINRMIDDIESGKVNNVLVFKVDRLTRSTRDLLELTQLFEDYNCAFNSLTESIDTDTPSGRMFLKIIGIFAEFERENISMRSRLGKERQAKEGFTIAPPHKISYGYTREKGQKIQTINLNEAIIVKEIFSMFLDKNMSFHQIAKTLTDRKTPTKTKVSAWSAATIKCLLMNPNLIGRVRYSTTNKNKYFESDGQHEPIISEELFYLVQEKIKNTPQILRTKHPKERSYFCGVLTCGICNSKFTTHNYKKANSDQYYTAYRCNRKKNPSLNKCKCPDIAHTKVEYAFYEYIQNYNDITEDKDINLNENAQNSEQELLKNIVECEKNIEKLQNRKRQINAQYVNEDIEFDNYKDMIRLVNENHEALETELQRHQLELSNTTILPEILPKDVILNLQQNWEHLSNSERMIFLQRFIKKISIIVEKEHSNNNIVRIDNIEFHTGELPKREKIRAQLR